jgi:PAS domain-containing protein
VADNYSDSASPSEESEGGDSREKLLEIAKARFKVCVEAESENRTKAADDRKFRAGDQWPDDVKAARDADGRPCLTINKMPQFEQQVTNDQRQNRPAIKVHPVDDVADPKTAKVHQGLIKHIEVSSGADTARDTAFENAVRGGYGYYRIVTEYLSPDSFEQEIRVKRIRDADTVYLDPNHQEPDGSDAEYGFIFERKPKDLYIDEYGESKLAKTGEWDLGVSSVPDWVEQDTVLIAEYFYKEYETKTLALLSDGQVMEKAEAEKYIASRAVQATDEAGQPIGEPAPDVSIVRERTARTPSIKWCKLNGVEILSQTDWPGRWIPILPVYGAEIVVDGKLIRESLIRHAKDPARMYNFMRSNEAETITLAPKAPWVIEEHQLEGYEHDWATANKKNHAFLKYKAHSVNGTPIPPPQRQAFEPPIQAVTQASMLAADEVKATMGLYDASLGNRSNETSGIAIQRRNQQAQTSNFHFTDNLNRTIRHEGRILLDLIPHIYDTARTARIIGEDGEQDVVQLNQEYQDKSGETVKHALGVGKYDVTIDTGPSYQTRRQEAQVFMQDMVKAYPATMQVAGDLVLKNSDVPGAADLAERFKKTIDPKLIGDNKGAANIPPEAKAQMEQMGGMIEQLTRKVNELQTERETKLLELESRERIESMKIEAQVALKMAELDQRDSLALLQNQIDEINQRQALLRVSEPVDPEAGAPGPQDFAPPPDGGMPADVGEEGLDPTGGESPGLPIGEPQ